jgi:TolA-binding protein
MTDHVARLYAVLLSLVVLFVTWAVVAARPWAAEAATKDPRLVALERREERLQRQSVRVKRIVERRFANYEKRLRERQAAIAALQGANTTAPAGAAPAAASAPSVSVSALPPLTQSGSS